MRLAKRYAAALVALAAALPAQALEEARLAPALPFGPTCYSGESGGGGEERPPVLIPGLGSPTGLKPDTPSPEAAKWFEQGLLLVWAYDEAEAIRAFRKAQQLDDGCALCHWGEALARSPTLNLQPPFVDVRAAAEAAERAAQRAARRSPQLLTEEGRGLVRALQIRAPRSGPDFDYEGYAQFMDKLANDGKASDPVLVLAADAEIVRWSNNQTPLRDARTWLETVLVKRAHRHSGAMHFYIHLADIIETPSIALPYADELGRLAPAASHLLHMPSHSFYSNGEFGKAVEVNRNAIRAYISFEALGPAVSGYRRYLFAHDHHYAIQSALIHGDSAGAIDLARQFGERFPAQDPLFRIRPAHFAAPWYVRGRFGDLGALLAEEPTLGYSDAARALSGIMWHYALGEAYARRGDARNVTAQGSAIAAALAGLPGRSLDTESEALALIAQHVLEGRAAMLQGRYADAAAAYRVAMNAQYVAPRLAFDPPPFWYGARRSLAAALLAGGDAEGAERQLTALQPTWPDDPLALLVYSRSEAALKRPESAADYLRRARARWAGGDIARTPDALI